jgi:hypothetical protein
MRRPAIIAQECEPFAVAFAMARPPTRFPFIYNATFRAFWIDSSSGDRSQATIMVLIERVTWARGAKRQEGGVSDRLAIHIESEIQIENPTCARRRKCSFVPVWSGLVQSKRRPGSSQAFHTVLAQLTKSPPTARGAGYFFGAAAG